MYVITRACPIECLAPLLSRPTFRALVQGVPDSPATVGQVIDLYEQHRLMAIMSINTGRYGEIRRSLIEAKLIGWSSRSVIQRRSMQDASVPYWHHATRLPRPKRGLLNPVTVILRMVIAVTSGIQGCTDLVSVHRLPVGLAFPARSSTRAEGWICGLSSSQVRVAPIGI